MFRDMTSLNSSRSRSYRGVEIPQPWNVWVKSPYQKDGPNRASAGAEDSLPACPLTSDGRGAPRTVTSGLARPYSKASWICSRARENLPDPRNHGRFVIGEPERLPCPHAVASALDRIKLAVYTCRAQLVAKSFRLSKGHNVIVGAVNQ